MVNTIQSMEQNQELEQDEVFAPLLAYLNCNIGVNCRLEFFNQFRWFIGQEIITLQVFSWVSCLEMVGHGISQSL